MNNLKDIADRIESRLEEKDQVREVTIKSTRAINRLSGSIIHSIHKGENVSSIMHDAIDEAHRLRSLLKDHPDMWASGLVIGSLQELAEAAILLALINEDDLPDPDEMGLPGTAYLLGMADVIGELRRFALEQLREGRQEEASKYLDMMEELFLVLMRFDYPDAIIPIRRKQDIARSLLEKTRGEVAVAVNSAMLQAKLEDLTRKL